MSEERDYIESNKEHFESILRENVTREGADVEGLIEKLESSDFFYAPASTKYHSCYAGGLCQHSLNVYYNLKNLIEAKGYGTVIPEESIAICGLLHDLSKMNFYEPTVRNKKLYFDEGTKKDEIGNFDWVSEKSWGYVSDDERFIFGNHEETSEFMARTFIPLNHIESAAIMNHHGGIGFDSSQGNTASRVMARYPLAAFLHMADMISVYVDERETNE